MAPNQDLLEKVFATGKGDDSDQFLKQFLAQRAWADQDDDDDDAAPIHVLDQVCCQAGSASTTCSCWLHAAFAV